MNEQETGGPASGTAASETETPTIVLADALARMTDLAKVAYASAMDMSKELANQSGPLAEKSRELAEKSRELAERSLEFAQKAGETSLEAAERIAANARHVGEVILEKGKSGAEVIRANPGKAAAAVGGVAAAAAAAVVGTKLYRNRTRDDAGDDGVDQG